MTGPDDPRGAPAGGATWRLPLALALYAALSPALVGAWILSRSFAMAGQPIGYWRAFAWQAIVYGAWLPLGWLVAWAGRRWRVRGNEWLAPFPAFVAAGLVTVPLASLVYAAATWTFRPAPATGRPDFGSVATALFLDRLPINLLIFWGIVGLAYAFEHFRALRERERRAMALEAQLARASLHALAAQLQPHFLFNALQAIATLVRSRPDDAVRMTVRLGDLLRETLHRSGTQEHTLAEELRLLEHYVGIERVRFGDRLRVLIEPDEDALDCLVPTLALQPLVENAIRHGLAPLPGGGTVRVGARCSRGALEVTVTDDGVGLASYGGDGTGLSNTRERLLQLHGPAAALALAASPGGRGAVAGMTLPCRRGGAPGEQAKRVLAHAHPDR